MTHDLVPVTYIYARSGDITKAAARRSPPSDRCKVISLRVDQSTYDRAVAYAHWLGLPRSTAWAGLFCAALDLADPLLTTD